MHASGQLLPASHETPFVRISDSVPVCLSAFPQPSLHRDFVIFFKMLPITRFPVESLPESRQTIGSVLNKHERKNHRPVFCTLRQLVCHFTKICDVHSESRACASRVLEEDDEVLQLTFHKVSTTSHSGLGVCRHVRSSDREQVLSHSAIKWRI